MLSAKEAKKKSNEVINKNLVKEKSLEYKKAIKEKQYVDQCMIKIKKQIDESINKGMCSVSLNKLNIKKEFIHLIIRRMIDLGYKYDPCYYKSDPDEPSSISAHIFRW